MERRDENVDPRSEEGQFGDESRVRGVRRISRASFMDGSNVVFDAGTPLRRNPPQRGHFSSPKMQPAFPSIDEELGPKSIP